MVRRLRVRAMEAETMCARPWGGFLDVKGCVKFFGAVFRGVFAWTFSMLSALGFLIVVSPDCGRYLFGVVDGGVYRD
jgi:hypothetical protein